MDNYERVQQFKKWFKSANDAEQKQREREKEDLSFQIAENQWDPEARRYRKGTATSPGRPMLSVSLLNQPIQLIQNQAVQAHLGVEIHPVSEQADPEVAEVKQGLYRRIERDSNASLARLWALNRAVQCGRGWYRVTTQWDEDGDDPSDQEIVIERILYQEGVLIDPSAQKPDFSDARWGMLVNWLDIEDFRAMWPEAEAPLDDMQWKSWNRDDPNWVRSDGERKAVLVAEVFWKEPIKSEEKEAKNIGRQRGKVQLKWAVVSGRELLEQQDLDGQYIPLIPVIGKELQPFDGQRIWEGLVRPSRDGQKFFNFSISTLVERMAMEPKAPFIGAEGQFRSHEDEWTMANIRNQPYLEYRPVSHEGHLAPAPQRAQVDASGMSTALMALDQAKQFVQSSTSVFAPSLGEMPSEQSKQSGRAILALQQQSDAGTSHFLQNLAQISMTYEARVILDLMPHIYDRPGRIVQVLGAEDDPKYVMLGKPYVEHPENGRPVAAEQAQQMGMPGNLPVKTLDLTKGKYTISVNVGKSFQTRLQEGANEIGQILQGAPQLMPIIGPTYFRFRDFPGAREIADLLKKVREKQFPGLEDDGKSGPSPEQMQEQIQQMGMQMQQMGQALQNAMMELKTKQAEQQAAIMKAQLDAQTTMQKAQLDAETKMRIDAADNETKLALAGKQQEVDAILTLLKLEQDKRKIDAENARTLHETAHEATQNEADRQHDALLTMASAAATKPPDNPEEEAQEQENG